jgi:ERCC4-related helicase
LNAEYKFLEDYKKANVLIMLNRKFLQHLIHGDIDVKDFDYIFFDEIHSSNESSAYNSIMTKFYFDHDIIEG